MTLRITELPRFSSQLKYSIQSQLNQFNSAQQIQKVKQNIKHIQQAQKDIETPQLSLKLTYNIIFQFLRKHNLNYTYNTLVNEAKFPMKDIVYTDDLRTIIGLKETDKEIRKHFQHNYTIIDIMLQTIEKSCKQKTDSSTQTFQIDNSINVQQMFNRKYDALKEQLSKIYEKEYTQKSKTKTLLESSEIKQIKQQLQIEFELEYQNRYKAKSKILESKQQSMKRKQTEFIRIFNQKIQSMATQSARIKQQSKHLKQELKIALFKIQSHDCFQQQNYKKQVQALSKEKYKVRQLENKYKLALSNLNTKVQDLISQKQTILAPNQKFYIDKQRRMKLDDVTTRNLLSSITRLEQRVNMLAGDNMSHIKQSQVKNKRIRYLQTELRRVQDLLVSQQDTLNRTIELRDRYQVQKKTIGTNVNQQQILSQTVDVSEEELKHQQEQIFKMIEESNKQRLEYLNNLDRINIEMQYIKQKVKDLGEDDI